MHQSKLTLSPVSSIPAMLDGIFKQRPKLRELATDTSIVDYLRPALMWEQQRNIFPHASVLQDIISSSIERLYGAKYSKEGSNQLENSWVVETGAHLHIPRRYNNVNRVEGAQINSLLFQGQVLWALANHQLGHGISLSLNSGRVPLDNTNSGAYLDLPALKNPITLASKRKHPDSPQSLIPARTKEEIQEKIALLTMYKKQKLLPENQYEVGYEVLSNFLKVQSIFSDQVATSHALLLDKVLPLKQVTLDSELIGRDFILALLRDPSSITYSIFTNEKRRAMFFDYLSDIRTGWPKGGSPFSKIVRKHEGYRLITSTEDLNVETLIQGLEENTLWPTGVMKFFVLMVEAGLLSVGGWTQATYTTEVKEQSVKLLHALGYEQRADALQKMPTELVAVGPCWGITKHDDQFQLLDAMTSILEPKRVDAAHILDLTGMQSLIIAAPTLYEFLLGESVRVDKDDLQYISRSALIATT